MIDLHEIKRNMKTKLGGVSKVLIEKIVDRAIAAESKIEKLDAQEHIGEIVVDTERGYQFVGGDLIDDLIDGRHKVYIQPKPPLQPLKGDDK